MLVLPNEVEKIVHLLGESSHLSLDTETSGLRPYHGDRLFSIAISNGDNEYYFDFNGTLSMEDTTLLKPLIQDKKKTWYLANAKYDMAILANEGLYIRGGIFDVLAIERVLKNDEMSYSLKSVAKRHGMEKSDEVERYIEENKLWEYKTQTGKQTRTKHKFYNRVPLEIISRYAEQDARITYDIAKSQKKTLQGIINETQKNLPNIRSLLSNERVLTKVVHGLEATGVRVDRDYCHRAIIHEQSAMDREILCFKERTRQDYMASPKLFATVFASEKDQWSYTDKNNPSFDTEALKKIKHPAAKTVLSIRNAKSNLDFYHGFLHHADANGDIHPNFNQGGTATGRFSSSSPNFQNLVNEEGDEYKDREFLLRRALIPRPGFIFIMPDYSAMEYRLMLEYAGCLVGYETPLIKEVKAGKDVHQATADLVTASGHPLSRSKAKNANFSTLYGSGIKNLAQTLGATEAEAKAVKGSIFKAAPEIQRFIQSVMKCTSQRGYIFNWLGRRSYFPDSNFAYKAPNYLIQGGCADIIKVAMVRVHEYLQNKQSRMVMTIHDELVIEVHESEIACVPREVHSIMEKAYPSTYMPMACSMEWSDKSLADKQKGFPV